MALNNHDSVHCCFRIEDIKLGDPGPFFSGEEFRTGTQSHIQALLGIAHLLEQLRHLASLVLTRDDGDVDAPISLMAVQILENLIDTIFKYSGDINAWRH